MKNNLIDRVNYNTKYLDNYEEFAKKILNYKSVPYQIEIQPGREKGKALCWMSCPYCYGVVLKILQKNCHSKDI